MRRKLAITATCSLFVLEVFGLPILEHRAGREPEIGIESHVVQGEALYAEYSYVAQMVARPEADLVAKKTIVPAGTPLYASAEMGLNGDKPMTSAQAEKEHNLKRIRFVNDGPDGGFFMDKLANGSFDHYKSRALPKYVKYHKDWLPVSTEVATSFGGQTFRREIVYQGAGGGVLRLLYREFVNDMARPAFSQELTYDLNSDAPTTVAVKDCRIKIFYAGNEGIKYEVLKGFSS